MRLTLLMLAWLLVLIGSCWAAPPGAADFAAGYYLQVDGKGAIYSVELPEDVYKTVTRNDLGDIRVFNGEGEVVPHTIRVSREEDVIRDEWQPLPYFPLYRETMGDAGDLSMQVRRSSDGSILEVRSKNVGGTAQKQLDGYLLDIGSLQKPLAALALNWKRHGDGSLVHVAVESSGDLLHWQPCVNRATLAELSFNGQLIRQNIISLPAIQDRYLRLRWLEPHGLVLTSANGRTEVHDAARVLKWLTMSGALSSENENKPEILYELRHRLPVAGVRVDFPDTNAYAALAIFSRRDNKQDWRQRCRKNFYQLQVDEVRLADNTCLFMPTEDSLWRVDVVSDGAGLSQSDHSGQVEKVLALQFGYRPHELSFIARGKPPYLLAYGSGLLSAGPAMATADIVGEAKKNHAEGSLVKHARLGKHVVLGGDAALAVPEPPLPWKTWVLWLVLVAGVVLLVFMTRSLLRDMRGKKE